MGWKIDFQLETAKVKKRSLPVFAFQKNALSVVKCGL